MSDWKDTVLVECACRDATTKREYVSRIEADQRIEEQISRATAAEIRVQRTEAEADGLQRMFDCLVAEHNQLRKENEAAEAKLTAVIDMFTYERNGHRFTGFNGDSNVTDKLAALLGEGK